MEKRGKDFKRRRTVTVTSSNVLLPHTQPPKLAWNIHSAKFLHLVDRENCNFLGRWRNRTKSLSFKTNGYRWSYRWRRSLHGWTGTFGYATITKVKGDGLRWNHWRVGKTTSAFLIQEVLKGINIALRKKISQQILRGAGTTNTLKGIFRTGVEALCSTQISRLRPLTKPHSTKFIYALWRWWRKSKVEPPWF